ncbi:hypothetical protein KP509_27G052800 [Ceratopteris richardii]|uniref:Pentatricopeptide repeat-containing protein n=1 Tax=Ceratopteris richardii TaxID=49495 RepID=A0A8T2RGG7_CERRI|nr:hypothetical protein KP509_27G052800 [Ceratopteris richardii]
MVTLHFQKRVTEGFYQICFAGGGKRPRRPYIWKSRNRRGSFTKSDKLLELLEPVSNVKEEVYGVLDGFVAWELDFPLIPIRKAIQVLEKRKNWPRIIQIIKWMLGKGQGRTLGIYTILLRAFSAENRVDEAQELFRKIFSRHLDCTPIAIFTEIMRVYERNEMYEDILEVFADMEELNIRLNDEISKIVSRTYEKIGDTERALRVSTKYSGPKFRWRTIGRSAVKFRNVERDVCVSRWTRNDNLDHASVTKGDIGESGSGSLGDSEAREEFTRSMNWEIS